MMYMSMIQKTNIKIHRMFITKCTETTEEDFKKYSDLAVK